MNLVLVFGFAVCMTRTHWGNDDHDSWMYNANDNAMAFASEIDMRIACEQQTLCNGAPTQCSIILEYEREGGICYEHPWIDIPIARVECLNTFNCSWYGDWNWWGPNPDPNDCCQIVEPTDA